MQWIHVRADVRRMAALTSASGTDLDVNGFSFTHIRSTHVTDFLTCACGLKGHFTPAANIEVASDRVDSSTAWTFFLGHCDDMYPLSPQFQHVLAAFAPLPSTLPF